MFSLRHIEADHDIMDSQLINITSHNLPNVLVFIEDLDEYVGSIITPEYFTPTMYIKYLRDQWLILLWLKSLSSQLLLVYKI
jgi:hypothetical protein